LGQICPQPTGLFTGLNRHIGKFQKWEANQRYRKDVSYLNENILTYNKVLGDHSFNVVGGYTWQIFHYKHFEASSTGYSTDLY
jgi:hypothetical protein